MCVIAYGKAKAVRKHVRQMMDANPHGAGIAYFHPSGDLPGLVWVKGLGSVSKVVDVLDGLGNADVVFHARIATAGDRLDRLTHPFPVELVPSLELTGRGDMLLFQNGHFAGWKELAPEGATESEWSDTRAIAHALASGKLSGEQEEIASRLGSKICILSEYRGKASIKFLGAGWHYDIEGMTVSNLYWKWERTKTVWWGGTDEGFDRFWDERSSMHGYRGPGSYDYRSHRRWPGQDPWWQTEADTADEQKKALRVFLNETSVSDETVTDDDLSDLTEEEVDALVRTYRLSKYNLE